MNQKRPALFQDGNSYKVEVGGGFAIAWRLFKDAKNDTHLSVHVDTPLGSHVEMTHSPTMSSESIAELHRALDRVDGLLAGACIAVRRGDAAAADMIQQIVEHKAHLTAVCYSAGIPLRPIAGTSRH